MEDPENRLVPETKSLQHGEEKLHNSHISIEAMENGVYLGVTDPGFNFFFAYPESISLRALKTYNTVNRTGDATLSPLTLLHH